jgi:hypothetical protein
MRRSISKALMLAVWSRFCGEALCSFSSVCQNGSKRASLGLRTPHSGRRTASLHLDAGRNDVRGEVSFRHGPDICRFPWRLRVWAHRKTGGTFGFAYMRTQAYWRESLGFGQGFPEVSQWARASFQKGFTGRSLPPRCANEMRSASGLPIAGALTSRIWVNCSGRTHAHAASASASASARALVQLCRRVQESRSAHPTRAEARCASAARLGARSKGVGTLVDVRPTSPAAPRVWDDSASLSRGEVHKAVSHGNRANVFTVPAPCL